MHEDGDHKSLPQITGETEAERDESSRQYEAAEALYLRTHAEWVDALIGNATLATLQEQEASHGL